MRHPAKRVFRDRCVSVRGSQQPTRGHNVVTASQRQLLVRPLLALTVWMHCVLSQVQVRGTRAGFGVTLQRRADVHAAL